jgi:hypothetical protein
MTTRKATANKRATPVSLPYITPTAPFAFPQRFETDKQRRSKTPTFQQFFEFTLQPYSLLFMANITTELPHASTFCKMSFSVQKLKDSDSFDETGYLHKSQGANYQPNADSR